MTDKKVEIKCPQCGKVFSIDDALKSDLEAGLKEQHQKDLEEAAKKGKELAKNELSLEMKDLMEKVAEQEKKLFDAQKTELDLRKKAREMDEKSRQIDLEVQRKTDESTARIREEASKNAAEENRLKLAEKDQKLESLHKQVEEMKRKMEVGSQQAQGEVLELELEEVLKQNCPMDSIEPIAKGVRGGDILHKVVARGGQTVGTILWESKRAKNWANDWLTKLKDDQRQATAEIAVLVTQAFPKEFQHEGFGPYENVLLCDLKSYVPLALVLRAQLIQLQQLKGSMENKGGKMEVLYNYLTGTAFRQRVEAIVETFTSMKKDLDKEKKGMQSLWAKREQQLGKVVENTAGMYGELQGLIGANLPKIESLELDQLPEPEKQ